MNNKQSISEANRREEERGFFSVSSIFHTIPNDCQNDKVGISSSTILHIHKRIDSTYGMFSPACFTFECLMMNVLLNSSLKILSCVSVESSKL
jgi:hypothetical protein